MVKKLIAIFVLTLTFIACSRVPITNRRQIHLLPESEMIAMSLVNYSDFLDANNVVSSNSSDAKMVQRVGQKISMAVEEYLAQEGESKRVEGFQWEFHLVNDPSVNAWCMPGGKVVVYTGLLDVTKDESGLAVVMGHEIAHAIARHGNERMSQQLMIQAGGFTLSVLTDEKPQLTQDIFMMSYGIGSGLGALSFSRKHESEADKLGLVFMSMARYNPRKAPEFWERMSASGGQQPPEFLSTHPNDETRIHDLNAFMDEALKYYKE